MRTLILAVVSFSVFLGRLPAQTWQTLGSGLDYDVRDLFTDTASGLLYVCGHFDHAGDSVAYQVATWDGAEWNKVGNYPTPPPCAGPCGTAFSVIPFEGNVFLSGSFTLDNAVFPGSKELWKFDGVNWASCGNPDSGLILELTNDKLFAHGHFRTLDGKPMTCVAMWNGIGWDRFGDSIPFTSTGDDLSASAFFQGNYFFGGNFDIGNDFHEILYWDGSRWNSPGNGIFGDAWVSKLKVYNGLLYAGGEISQASGNPDDFLVTWDGNTWGAAFPEVQFVAQVRDLEVIDDKLYIVGTHMVWDGSAWQGPYMLGRFDGTEFCSFGGIDIMAYDIAGLNGDLYISTMKELLGDTVNYIARWPAGSQMDICVSVTTGVSSSDVQPLGVLLFPNPTLSNFSLTLPIGINSCSLQIHDVTGREVLAVKRYQASDPPVDVCNLPSGLYSVQVKIRDKVEVIKLVKQ